jgi:hypothetical protein
MATLTVNTPESTLWSLFAAWARRAFESLPTSFADVDPLALRLMPPF